MFWCLRTSYWIAIRSQHSGNSWLNAGSLRWSLPASLLAILFTHFFEVDAVIRPPEHLKSLANRLATKVCTPEGAHLMQLLHQAGLISAQEEAQPAHKPG